MKSGILTSLLRFWAAVFLTLAPGEILLAQLNIDNTADITTADIGAGQVITFRYRYTCASTTSAATSAVITAPLDANLTMVAMQGSAHTTGTNLSGGNAVFTFISPLPAGSTGEVFLQAKFKSSTAANTVATNAATFSASNFTSKTSNIVSVTGINPGGGGGGGGPDPPPPFTPGLTGEKWGSSRITPLGPYLYYSFWHGNNGDAAQPLANYMIEDNFPPGTELFYFGSEQWQAEASLDVTVYYKTNTNPSWRQWSAGATYNTDTGRRWFYQSDLGLPPGEVVTGLRWSFGTLPGGGDFHPDRFRFRPELCLYMPNPANFTPGVNIQNCATFSATGYSTTHCAVTTVDPDQAEPYIWTSNDSPSGGDPYGPGQVFQIQMHIGNDASSNAAIVDPVAWIVLPPQFEFTGDTRVRWWATGSANDNPVVTSVPDYPAAGNTLVELKWPGMTIPNNRTYNEMMVEVDARVKPGTPAATSGYYVNTFASWTQPVTQGYFQDYDDDDMDVDRDGNKTEEFAQDGTTVEVASAGSGASLTSVMYVKGELDSAWTQFPATGQTVVGGKADYELHLTNSGGVALKDAIVIDILPITGDTGVIDTTARGSQWTPFLVDAVTAPAGVTVLYSTVTNPCRPELVPSGPPGCTAPAWSATPPDDITTVRSLKFDMTGLQIVPGDKVVLAWPMRAPWGAPTGGEIAWNSAGFTATRADNLSTLLPTEPAKTGIAIQKPSPPYYGDRVWMDANRNGVQDSGENGINGLRVELFRDNGDGIANPMTDTFVGFTATYREGTADGSYLFGNMGAGNYFAVVMAPPSTGVTLKDAAAAADDTDSDGSPITYRSRRAAIMPVTNLTALEEDRTWDQGFYPRTNIPAVWAAVQDSTGRTILGGTFTKSHGAARKNIVRVTSSGDVDTTFNPGTGFDGSVRSLAVRGDGMIWVGGNFTTYNGQPSKGVALLNANGTWDSRPARPDTTEVNWVGTNGTTMYLGGGFGKVGGIPCGNVARLNADGTVDTTFNKGAGANATVFSGGILTDGSLILVGAFSSYNGSSRSGVVKVKTDGSVDGSFNPGTGAGGGEVYSVKLIEDGRMILTGNFRSFDGVTCNGAVRLMSDGKVDTTMGQSALTVESINTSN